MDWLKKIPTLEYLLLWNEFFLRTSIDSSTAGSFLYLYFYTRITRNPWSLCKSTVKAN